MIKNSEYTISLIDLRWKIFLQSKIFEKHYSQLRKCLTEQNTFEFLKQLRIMKQWCISTSENFDEIIFVSYIYKIPQDDNDILSLWLNSYNIFSNSKKYIYI